MVVKRLGKGEILARYADAKSRSTILELLDLRSFLLHCIIRSSYKISDALNDALSFTPYGASTVKEFASKASIPVKEARLTAFLEFYHLDLLVDPNALSVDELRAAISKEILDDRIKLPFIHGPMLYKKAAVLTSDERPYLGTHETLRLLEGTPIGVFQMGRWVSGPRGLLKSSQARRFRPTLRVPLQHCHDISCNAVHRVRLSTDPAAPINQHRYAASKILESQSEEPSDFGEFFAEVSKNLSEGYDDFHRGSLPYLVGGAFSDVELRSILIDLLDSTAGDFRAVMEQVQMQGSGDQWAGAQERADLVQQILLAKDDQIVASIDRLVLAERILVPEGEIRWPLLFARERSGAFGARAELSRHGVRFSGARDLAPLRLRRLVEAIFVRSEAEGVDVAELARAQELDWQLRAVPGATLESRLDEFLRKEEPDEVVRRLVLSRREHVDTASKHLDVQLPPSLDDGAIVSRLLWKLGFSHHGENTMYSTFASRHEAFRKEVRTASVSSSVDWVRLRELAANYFVSVEGLLAETLYFAVWILTADHVAAKHQFRFDPSSDEADARAVLNGLNETVTKDEDRVIYGESATLHPLCQGFQRLARILEKMQQDEKNWARPVSEYPEFAGNTDIQDFPFAHKAAFLDLTPDSQARISATLREASRAFIEAKVPNLRNDQLHYRSTQSDVSELDRALGVIERVVSDLQYNGFVRVLFYPDRHEVDHWGRATYHFKDRTGRRISVSRPSRYIWLNLPALGQPQYLVTSAQFAEPHEMLRATLSMKSEFTDMWRDIPLRREASGRDMALGYETQEPSGQRAPEVVEE